MTHEPRDESLDAAVRALPTSIEPPRDLWPSIERRLAPRRRTLPAWLPLAAAIALVVLGGGLTRLLTRAPHPQATPDLFATFEQQPGALSPATLATLRRNLGVIDSALAESQRALARDPRNDDAQALQRLAQRQRSALLQQATRLRRS